VRFVLYSDKTVSQCLSALNERMQQPAAANRPALGGWVEKGGKFSISLKSVILGVFTRTTRLEGAIERDSGSTVIRGSVPDGVPPAGQIMILLTVIVIGLLIIAQGKALLGIIAVMASFAIYIPLRGDYENSDRLLIEVERTLKADPKPKKSTTNGSSTAKKSSTPASASNAKKPAASAAKKTQTAPAVSARKPATTR
jgi:hypothetical protein